ncbi:MAG: hypothetical protein ACR2M1_06930 [Gemmatimonadaceae bacterium]
MRETTDLHGTFPLVHRPHLRLIAERWRAASPAGADTSVARVHLHALGTPDATRPGKIRPVVCCRCPFATKQPEDGGAPGVLSTVATVTQGSRRIRAGQSRRE